MSEEEGAVDEQRYIQKCAVPMTGSRLDSAMSAPARSIPMLQAELVELGAGAMGTPVLV